MVIALTESQFHGLKLDTIIETNEGRWIKADEGLWSELNYHCADCVETVLDAGYQSGAPYVGVIPPKNEKAWDYFKQIKVVAIPLSIVEEEWKKV